MSILVFIFIDIYYLYYLWEELLLYWLALKGSPTPFAAIKLPSQEWDDIKWKKFTYHPMANYRFQKMLKKFKINLSFNNRVNSSNKLSKNIDKKNKDDREKSGIFEIKCETCEKSDIWRTKRSLSFREHINNICTISSEAS